MKDKSLQETGKDIVAITEELEAKINANEKKPLAERVSLLEEEIENILTAMRNHSEWQGKEGEAFMEVMRNVSKIENRRLIEKALEAIDLKNTDFLTEFGEYVGGSEVFKILAWIGMTYWVGVLWYGLAKGFTEEAFFWSLHWIEETGVLSLILYPTAIASILYGIGGWYAFFAIYVKRRKRRK